MPYPTNDVSGVVNEQLYISPIFTIFFTLEYRSFFPFFTSLTIRVNSENCPLFTIGNTKKTNFTWEQRELDDFGISTGGTSIESAFSDEGKYKVISIGSYSESSIYNDQGLKALENDKTKIRVLNKDDLTMILNDKTASGRIIGRVLLIDKDNTYVYNQRTQRIEPKSDEFDALFLYHLLNAPQMRDKIIKQAQGNTQIYVNWSTIKATVYLVPKIEEQIVLGKYFEKIDNLITLHQRKYIFLI